VALALLASPRNSHGIQLLGGNPTQNIALPLRYGIDELIEH
jgi:hypothetical protein